MGDRILSPEDIPKSLWNGDNLLYLPRALRDVYRKILDSIDKLEEACKDSPRGSIGGDTLEETDLHFVHSFDGSCARVELAMLDPKDELENASDSFVQAFSGGRVRLLDIPCGCGAASAALLATVSELRRQNVLPREPLDVIVTGGDKSDPARNYAELVFGELKESLRNQGIFVSVSFHSWDVMDAASTTSLLDQWLSNQDCDRFFLLIANFSGILGNEGKIKKANERLGEVIRWTGARKSTIAWIEPQTKKARRMSVNDVLGRVFECLRVWSYEPTDFGKELTSESKYAHPVCKGKTTPNVRLLLYRMERPRR